MMNYLIKMKNKKGFTLVELIVVIAILGVIAAIATPSLISYVSSAKVDADSSSALALENSIKRAIAKGTITINGSNVITTAEASIKTSIQSDFPTIPVPQQNTAWFFFVNKNNYKVLAAAAAADAATATADAGDVAGDYLKIN